MNEERIKEDKRIKEDNQGEFPSKISLDKENVIEYNGVVKQQYLR